MQRFLILIALAFLASCNGRQSYSPATAGERNDNLIKDAAGMIQTGDIVLRCGKDITSYRIRAMSETDQTYSHAGIAFATPHGIMIYHITSPDSDESRGDTLVRLEPLEKFARPGNNFEFGIGRFNISKLQTERMISYLDSLKNAGVSFDYLFDLSTRNKMYCSEMVDYAIRVATNDSIALKRNTFNDPVLVRKVSMYLNSDEKTVRSRIYIPIENIYLHQHFRMIAQYKFEK